MATIIVVVSLTFGSYILAESTLSFLMALNDMRAAARTEVRVTAVPPRPTE